VTAKKGIVKEMDNQMENVLSGIRKGVEIDDIQECMNLEDNTLYAILVELVRVGKVKIEAT